MLNCPVCVCVREKVLPAASSGGGVFGSDDEDDLFTPIAARSTAPLPPSSERKPMTQAEKDALR